MAILEAIIDFFGMLAKLTGGVGSMAATGSRRREMREFAAGRGRRWLRAKRSLTEQFPFELFQGKRGVAANVVRLGPDEFLFDFNYGSSRGRAGSAAYAPHIHTCLIAPVNLTGPAVRISPRVLESAQRVPFESEAFNRRFTVTSGNPLFASAVVDQRMMQWLLEQPGSWRIEIRNRRLLCSAPLVPIDRLDEMEAFARGFRDRIPAVARTWRTASETA